MSTLVQIQSAVASEPSSKPLANAKPEPYTDDKSIQRVEEVEITSEELFSDGQDDDLSSEYSNRPDSGSDTESTQPETQNALIVAEDRQYRIVTDFPVPRDLAPNEVMIRNHAAGLNHIDWKSVEYNFCLPELPWIVGREMAGVVEQVGCSVTKLQKGDRVWTSTYYRDRRAGCFQDLVIVPEHTAFLIPTGLDFNQAACLGVAGLTAAMSLWRWLGVPMDPVPDQVGADNREPQEREAMLIWGGSTVTGQFAIQLASQAGFDVIAVCSTATADLVRELGAAHVVTYTDKTNFHVIGEILCLARGRLTKAIDLVGAHTAKHVLDVIAACGSNRTVDFAPLAFMSSKQVVPGNATVHNVEMKQFVLNSASEAYGVRLGELVAQGVLRLPAIRVIEGGLGAIELGLQEVKNGNLAGAKLVVSFDR